MCFFKFLIWWRTLLTTHSQDSHRIELEPTRSALCPADARHIYNSLHGRQARQASASLVCCRSALAATYVSRSASPVSASSGITLRISQGPLYCCEVSVSHCQLPHGLEEPGVDQRDTSRIFVAVSGNIGRQREFWPASAW